MTHLEHLEQKKKTIGDKSYISYAAGKRCRHTENENIIWYNWNENARQIN